MRELNYEERKSIEGSVKNLFLAFALGGKDVQKSRTKLQWFAISPCFLNRIIDSAG
jgi:hypothetical protein